MSYDAKTEGVLAMAIAMFTGNASEGVEAVQNAEQSRARNNCCLPIEMEPSKEDFEALGFTFTDIGDDVLCQATLPDGWSLKSDGGGYWTYLIDKRGRTRGSYFYKGAFYDRSGHMDLCRRFTITYKHTEAGIYDSPVIVCVMDADDTIVFTAGQCNEAYSKEYEKLMEDAKAYLHTNYSEWENSTMYWD